MYFKSYSQTKIWERIGIYFFKIGILLLPAALFYSSIFLFISFIISNIKSKNLIKDKWNIPLIICALLMIFICTFTNYNPIIFYNFKSDNFLNWTGLLNWIPMFWVYWCAQYYLKKCRRKDILCILFGLRNNSHLNFRFWTILL